MRLGYLTDIHLRDAVPGKARIETRKSRQMLPALERALAGLQDAGVDLVLCSGDMVDDPAHEASLEDLASLRERFEASGLPYIALPGNHDPDSSGFYTVFARPEETAQYDGIPFWFVTEDHLPAGQDAAVRPAEQVEALGSWLRNLPEDRDLAVVAQHYLIRPLRDTGYRYTYTNARVLQETMEGAEVRVLSISGHYHTGALVLGQDGVDYVAGAAFCELPFPYYVLDITADGFAIQRLKARPR
jgi:hypothetical protein